MANSKLVLANLRLAKRLWGGELTQAALSSLRDLIALHSLSIASGDLIRINGNWYITHAGLLRIAHRKHCSGILVRPAQQFCDPAMIVGFGATELFIIDNYLDTQLFDVYMENVSPAVTIRVFTNKVSGSLQLVAEKFSKRGKFELRSSNDVHDRVVFADDRCWVIGQSIKDAATKKPTYVVEHSGAATMKAIYEPIWAGATTIVKG